MKLRINSGEKPLWSQLYDILEDRILTGVYPIGEKMPSEMSIMEEFEVSRITVRQAMDKLLNSNLIARKRGKGTIVLKKDDKIETTFQSHFNGIYEKNNDTDRRVINFEFVIPPVEVAYFFNLGKNDKVWCLTRGIWVDNQVVANFETYINPIVPLNSHEDMSGSLYKKLQFFHFEINNVIEKVTASISTAKEKKIFMLSKNEAIIHRKRMGFCIDTPIEFTYSKYVSKGYELTINLQR